MISRVGQLHWARWAGNVDMYTLLGKDRQFAGLLATLGGGPKVFPGCGTRTRASAHPVGRVGNTCDDRHTCDDRQTLLGRC